jgi:hypothetical protein
MLRIESSKINNRDDLKKWTILLVGIVAITGSFMLSGAVVSYILCGFVIAATLGLYLYDVIDYRIREGKKKETHELVNQ